MLRIINVRDWCENTPWIENELVGLILTMSLFILSIKLSRILDLFQIIYIRSPGGMESPVFYWATWGPSEFSWKWFLFAILAHVSAYPSQHRVQIRSRNKALSRAVCSIVWKGDKFIAEKRCGRSYSILTGQFLQCFNWLDQLSLAPAHVENTFIICGFLFKWTIVHYGIKSVKATPRSFHCECVDDGWYKFECQIECYCFIWAI